MCTLKHKEVTIRKPRYCVGCLDKFPIGSKMIYYVGIVEGDLQTSYWCKVCDAYYNEYFQDPMNSFSEGDFRNEPHYLEFKKKYEENMQTAGT